MNVSHDTRLEVLDWGGKGRPLILLAGIGNTAHVYDEFAESLRADYHLYAITRRGFGASSQPAAGYDVPTSSRDVLAVMDRLGLATATLAGHSFAGEELTWLGTHEPSRIERLIYLDAAYDRTAVEDEGAPPEPEPTVRDLASPASFRRWLERFVGVAWPEAEIRATFVVDESGRVREPRTPPKIAEALLKSAAPPHYRGLRVPALAIYRVDDDVEQLVPHYWALDASGRSTAQSFFAKASRQLADSRAVFGREAPDCRVVELHGADHFIFLKPRDRTAAEIRSFLRP